MKKLFRMNSLKKKLITIFLALTIIPLVVTVAVIFLTTSDAFDKLITNQQADMEHIIQSEFDNVAEELQDVTEIYSQNLEFVEAFHADDRDTLFLRTYQKL
ncbi:hypothetical protein ACFOUV_01420 [Oceanobacillus longus]|uniref:Methyl-accepting chemotaxis protein n=1 Tax=Oceanobacillus longus TaxID=930120 RepID=A0ABV8GRK2_9BACI